jgi:hypothetical protein
MQEFPTVKTHATGHARISRPLVVKTNTYKRDFSPKRRKRWRWGRADDDPENQNILHVCVIY